MIKSFSKFSETVSKVFLEKTGFIPNLSCIDMLFNEGNWAIEILYSERD